MQVFNVQGMSCGHCVKAITQALQAVDPAASVRVDLAAKEVGVESRLSAEQVIQAITEALPVFSSVLSVLRDTPMRSAMSAWAISF